MEDLQSLLEKINRDGVEKAEAEAKKIVAAAQAKADEIVKDAQAAAAKAKAEAQTESEACGSTRRHFPAITPSGFRSRMRHRISPFGQKTRSF